MEERVVQHTVQENMDLAPGSAPVTPAPMVERAFRLLDLLSMSEEGLTLSELGRLLKMSKGSIHGLLKTLESCGVVDHTEERQYVLGPRIYNLAVSVQSTGLRRLAFPAMHRLASSIGETIFLGRVEHELVRVGDSVDTPQGLANPNARGSISFIVKQRLEKGNPRRWLSKPASSHTITPGGRVARAISP